MPAHKSATFTPTQPFSYARAAEGAVGGQYIDNPCDAMFTTGGVCPTFIKCAVVDRANATVAHAAHARDCYVRPLPGFGWNPSVVRAPHALRAAAAGAGIANVEFVATSRLDHGMQKGLVRCANLGTVNASRSGESNAALLLLDASLRVISQRRVLETPCPFGPTPAAASHGRASPGGLSPQDARLVPLGARGSDAAAELYVSYTNWERGCGGVFLSPLRVDFAPARRMGSAARRADEGAADRWRWRATLDARATRRLHSARNPGMLVARAGGADGAEVAQTSRLLGPTARLLELTQTAPLTAWLDANGTPRHPSRPQRPPIPPRTRASPRRLSLRVVGRTGLAPTSAAQLDQPDRAARAQHNARRRAPPLL